MIHEYQILAHTLLVYKYDDVTKQISTVRTGMNLEADSIALQRTFVKDKKYTAAGHSMYLDIVARSISSVISQMEIDGISSKELILFELIKLIEEEIAHPHRLRHVIIKQNDSQSKN